LKRREHRQLRIGERLALGVVAPPLLAHVAQAVLGAALLGLVEHDEVGIVEHVDLLELARGAILARHDVQRQVDHVDDLGVRLADASRLHDHQVEAARLVEMDHLAQHGGSRQVRAPRGERAHVDVVGGETIHADAVAEQRTAAAPPRRIHRDHGDLQLGEGTCEAREQLVREARLAGAAGAGDADHRGAVARASERAADLLGLRLLGPRGALEHRDGARHEAVVARIQRAELVRGLLHRADAGEHVIDHAGQPQTPAVLGRVDLLHPVPLERLDLVRRDGAATADYYANVRIAALAQHVDHVDEILVVATLIGTHRDGVGVLIDRCPHDVGDAAVVPEMHDLGAARLQQPPDHVDGGVVAVEE
jgi:hypothetical protein